jgi:ATP-dependent HslUV protease ATP-binding subunit HslU
MIHYLPDKMGGEPRSREDLTPRQIVEELDKHIIGQAKAKRAVAIALRNRQRRRKLPPELAAEVLPKNIILIGPTGVGKTEIARRIAKLTGSPFVKVEASRFTEVGYVGRDVESMVRDLTEISVDLVRQEKRAAVRARTEQNVEDRILQLLLPPPPRSAGFQTSRSESAFNMGDADTGDASGPETSSSASTPSATPVGAGAPVDAPSESYARTKDKLRRDLRAGLLEDRIVELEIESGGSPTLQIFGNQGLEEMGMNLKDMMPGLFGGKTRRRKLKISEAREYLLREEGDKLLDPDQVTAEALERVEQSGILFIDEIDKIAGRESGRGPDVSREGVQRDLLPIIEGTVVKTKHGMVRTDHIQFIAAGAFHVAKPSDLIPELQGRFPVRVELLPLSREDLVRILREPENSLLRQYTALLATEKVVLRFTDEAVDAIADFAMQVNRNTENIGARRLHTILEKLLEDISFEAPERPGTEYVVDAADVRRALADLVENQDLSRYVL